MYNGILPVFKKRGLTSHDVVLNYVKFKNEKIGHTGTLDPEVNGVLPICLAMRQKSVIISWKWENLSRYDNARKEYDY